MELESEEMRLKGMLKDQIMKKNQLSQKLEPFKKPVGFIKEYEKVRGKIDQDDFFSLVNQNQIDFGEISRDIEISLGTYLDWIEKNNNMKFVFLQKKYNEKELRKHFLDY